MVNPTELLLVGPATGSNVYGIIQDVGGKVFNGSAFVDYVVADLHSYAIPLTETPTGSRRFAAAMPALADGSYAVAYYLQSGGEPSINDELIAGEDFKIRATQTQVVTSLVNPLSPERDIDVVVSTPNDLSWICLDSDGNPIDLTSTVTFSVYADTFPDETAILSKTATTSGTDGNVAEVSLTTEDTTTPRRVRYRLTMGDTLLASGRFNTHE